MSVIDHLGITVTDLQRATAQWDPILSTLGYSLQVWDDAVSWDKPDEIELILYAARDESTAPHVHGRVGWQHLAFALSSRAEVERLHGIAREAGWEIVRAPKEYPRFSDRYYATFLEDADGIRIELVHNPPRAVS